MSADLRLFVAVMAPAPVQGAIAQAIDRLRPVAGPVRWVDPASAHVTLQFLGATAPARVPDLIAALATVATGARSMVVQTDRLGVFPSAARARVVWLGLCGATTGLATLQSAVVAATHPLGFPVETRPFTAHLTLGRVLDTATAADRANDRRAVAGSARPDPAAWTIAELALLRSDLSPRGATYTAVGRWPLADG